MLPPIISPDQGSNQAIPLADLMIIDKPFCPLAIAGTDGVNSALPLHLNHNGMNGALMAAGIQTHAPHNIGARLGTVLNQGGANGGANQGGEVHRGGVVN